ncbi:7254_t:CDS:2 [Diversispora eburnea]|uniref:7254_t:CDS:1 n=1 Tax=Diversispora eburnea TaxID=1213867 RepID=A0A9N8V2M8_9GLOM|nr:7254_t:CDS:2 [Diversispora eburnea]
MNFVNVEISEAGLKVSYSDGDPKHHPSIEIVVDSSGTKSHYRLVGRKEQKFDVYSTKLGDALGKALEKSGLLVPKALLLELPKGYELFENNKEYVNKPTRKDTYLFGNGSKYRSPAEFEEHLLWLASDKEMPCSCKYCPKDSYRNNAQSRRSVDTRSPSKFNQTIQKQNTSSIKRLTAAQKGKSKATSVNAKDENLSLRIDNKSRREDIIWADIKYVLHSSQRDSLFSEEGGDLIKYWPAIIREKSKAMHNFIDPIGNNSNNSSVFYTLQPLMLAGTKRLQQNAIIPWLAYSTKNVTRAIESKLRKEDNEHLLKTNEIRLLQQMESYPHYKAIFLGTELLKEDDYIRLTRPSRDSSTERLPIFKINTIFLNSQKKIQMSGDLFPRSPPSSKNDGECFMLKKLNKDKFEYTIDLSEIAGRYYKLHPNINQNMSCTIPVSYIDRMSIISETTKLYIHEATNTNIQNIQNIQTPRKQMAKRSRPLPPLRTKKHKIDHLTKETSIDISTSQSSQSSKSTNIKKVDMTRAKIVSPRIPFLDESDDNSD